MKVWKCDECVHKDAAPPCFVLFPAIDKPYFCVYPVAESISGKEVNWKPSSWEEMESFKESDND